MVNKKLYHASWDYMIQS